MHSRMGQQQTISSSSNMNRRKPLSTLKLSDHSQSDRILSVLPKQIERNISLKHSQNELQTIHDLVTFYFKKHNDVPFKRKCVSSVTAHDDNFEAHCSKRISLDSAIYAKKAKISRKLLSSHQNYSHLNVAYKTGDFLTIEFFKVTTPMKPGIYDIQVVGFICTMEEDNGTLEVEEIGSFWTKVNCEPRRAVVRDIFFQRPKNPKEETDIFLVVKGIGQKDDGSLVPGSFKTGIRRIGRWVCGLNGILAANIDFGCRAVYLRDEPESEMDVSKKWIPDYKTVAGLRKHFAKSSTRNSCEFLNMELSNEYGIGSSSEIGTKKFTSEQSFSCMSSPKSSSTKIKEYFILLSENTEMSKEESPASLSSGYGSMPSSAASIASSGNLFDELPVECQNSCLICRKRFPSVSQLLLHLELSYPSLTFAIDPAISHRINIGLAESSSQNRREFVFLTRSLLRSRRRQILSTYFPNNVTKPPARTNNAKTVALDEAFPVFFNMPRYQEVPFPGMHGVETPRFWVNEFQRRNISAFSDVNNDEKEMMIMWNEYINHRQNRVVTETTGSNLLKSFVNEKAAEIMDKAGVRNFLAHSASQYQRGYVDSNAIALCLRSLTTLEKSVIQRNVSKHQLCGKRSRISGETAAKRVRR